MERKGEVYCWKNKAINYGFHSRKDIELSKI